MKYILLPFLPCETARSSAKGRVWVAHPYTHREVSSLDKKDREYHFDGSDASLFYIKQPYLIGEKFVWVRLKYFIGKSFVNQEKIRHFSPTKTLNRL